MVAELGAEVLHALDRGVHRREQAAEARLDFPNGPAVQVEPILGRVDGGVEGQSQHVVPVVVTEQNVDVIEGALREALGTLLDQPRAAIQYQPLRPRGSRSDQLDAGGVAPVSARRRSRYGDRAPRPQEVDLDHIFKSTV